MQFLTDFADQAVLLPAIGLACFTMIAIGWYRAALALAGAAAAVAGVIVASKLTFMACPALASNAWGLRSPSGHTAMATLLYGGLAAIMIGSRRPVWSAMSSSAVAAGAVGASRVALGVHSIADVAVGSAIGTAAACAMVVAAGARPSRQMRIGVSLSAALTASALFHGQHVEAESTLARYARMISTPAMCRAVTASGRAVSATQLSGAGPSGSSLPTCAPAPTEAVPD